MNLAMECSPSDTVLDLSKTTKVETTPLHIPQPIRFSPPPPPMTQAYAPLTPPYYGSPPYQGSVPGEAPSSPPNPASAALVTSNYLLTSNVINAGRSGKPTRPFKAYPKDPLALSSFHDSTEEYIEFRQRMLAQLEVVSGRNNSNMRRSNSPQQPTSTAEVDDKTAAYWERRRKNNEAAKRSRDARRAKEDEIAIRAAFLEQENLKLKYELATLRTETAKLRHLVYNR